MEAKDLYALVVVEDPQAARDWYVRHLGFGVAFEADWFVYLRSPGPRRFGLAFMREGLEDQEPQFRSRLRGDALIITIEVEDVRSVLAEVAATGLEPAIGLRDERWGQRHFLLRDPSGLWVDIVQQIEPDPAYFAEADRERLSAALDEATG